MFRLIALILLLVFLFSCDSKPILSTSDADSITIDKDMAFVKGSYVFYYSKDNDSLHRIGPGADPVLSPDGNQLAYTIHTKANSSRAIAIVDLQSGIKRSIAIQSNHYGPSWNQDGSLLAFHLLYQNHWRIGLLDQNNNYTLLPEISASTPRARTGFSWSNDPIVLLTFTSDTLWVIDTAGVVKQTFAIEEITQGKAPSSSSKFTFSPDHRSILFTTLNPTAHYPPNQYRANAPDALYKYDLEKKLLVKLTPDSLNCWEYCWVNQDSIYFSAAPITVAESINNIYCIHTNGTGLKKILANAHSMTVQPGKRL